MLNITNFLCCSNIIMASQVSPNQPLQPAPGLACAGELPELGLSYSWLRLSDRARTAFPLEVFLSVLMTRHNPEFMFFPLLRAAVLMHISIIHLK